ncbi:MAG: hypothetical protein ACE5JO_08445, partial [Candidatus Binatia bacterium]
VLLQLLAQKIPEEVMVAIPLLLLIDVCDKKVLLQEGVDDLRDLAHPPQDGVAQLGIETI